MDSRQIQKQRRQVLKAYLDAEGLSLNAFALKIDHSQSLLHAALMGNKPFGEKLARTIETKVATKGLAPINLFAPDGAQSLLPDGPLPAIEQELLDVFRHLPPERQAQIVKDLAVEALRKGAARGPPPTPERDPAAGQRFG